MNIFVRKLVFHEELRASDLPDIVIIRAGLYQVRIHSEAVGRNFGERSHGNAVVIRSRSLDLQTLEERVRRVAQLDESQRRKNVEEHFEKR